MVMKVSITFISQDIFLLIEGQKVMGILSNKFIGYKLVSNIKETIQIVKEQLVQKSQIKIENKLARLFPVYMRGHFPMRWNNLFRCIMVVIQSIE